MSRKLTHEEFVEEMGIKRPDIEVEGQYVNANTGLHCKCKICGFDRYNYTKLWMPRPHRVLDGKTNCPKCWANSKRKTNFFDLSGEYGIGYFKDGTKFYFDLDDYDKYVKDRYWDKNANGYAVSYYFTRDENNKRIHHMIQLHREIMNAPQNKDVDHKNGIRYDNRRKNLRICESQQNDCNRGITKSNNSGVSGVCWDNTKQLWRAYITYKRKRYELGYFADFKQAVYIRENKEKELFGDFSRGVIEGRIA